MGQVTHYKQISSYNDRKKKHKQAWGEGGNGGYLPGHALCGPRGDDPPGSMLQLSISIPEVTAPVPQEQDWWGVAGPQGLRSPHSSTHPWWYL